MTKVRLVGDNLLVKADPRKTTTDSGIEIVEKITTSTTPMTGTVLARGSGVYHNGHYFYNDVNVNDKILFPKWAGQEIEIENDKYLLLKERDVLGIFKEEN